MINEMMLRGKWNQIKGKLQEKWGQLTDDDLVLIDGDIQRLVGRIQERTGESVEAIEHYLDTVAQTSVSGFHRLSERLGDATTSARQYARRAAGVIPETIGRAGETIRAGYAGAENIVRRRPLTFLVLAFGAGLLDGLIVGAVVALRRRR